MSGRGKREARGSKRHRTVLENYIQPESRINGVEFLNFKFCQAH